MNSVTLSLLITLGFCTTAYSSSESTLPPGDSAPATVFERVRKAGTAKEFDNAPFAILCDSTVNRVNEDGITYTDSYRLYKALTDEGCRTLAVQNWGYEPLSSAVAVKSVSIIRGDSAIVVPVDQVKDLPAPQRAIYWGDRVQLLQLPRLQVGDGVEVRTSRKGYSYALLDQAKPSAGDELYIPPMRGEYFDIVLFEATAPIVEKSYTLALPAAKRLHSRVYNGPLYSSTSYSRDTTYYTWLARNVPAWKPQRSHPGESDILTKVVLATVESWEAKSRWFFEVNDAQFAATDAIRAKVEEILDAAGASRGTDEQKAFALVHWVAQNIRYSGQTMGKGEGYTLHPGAMIFEQRSGVCKDIAGMLITMMRAAGLEANPAMTMAGSRIEEVPADQFNHCVVALRNADGSYTMYDPTWVPDYKDIWSKYESEQHYLIGSPTGEGLSRIPYSPPEESPMRVTHAATLRDDGTLEGVFEFRSDGAMDSRLRRMITRTRRSEMKDVLARALRVITDRIQIVDYQHGDPFDFSKSMWWKIAYQVPEYAVRVDGGYEFKSPLLLLTTDSPTLFNPATGDWPEQRYDDVFLQTTQLLDASEKIALPAGCRVTSPKNGKAVDETYAAFTGNAEMSGGELLVKQRIEIRRRQIPPDGYGGFRDAMTQAKKYAQTVFRAEKGGSR
jgi:hypothetical protein